MDTILEKIKKEFEEVENGNSYALDLYIFITNLEKQIKQIKDKCLGFALEESEKYSEKTFDYKGFLITKTNRTQYIFDDCNDPKMQILSKKEKELKAELKERQDFLKYLKEPIADLETGEIIYPAIKIAKDTLTIKQKKK